jgi:hypothetical protein
VRVETTFCVWKSHSACINDTLHVEITLVRIDITVVSVVRTFVRVKITLHVEILLCVYISHSMCRNRSCVYLNHSRKCRKHICVCQNHTACGNYTLRVEITFVRVKITIVSIVITFVSVKITLRVEIALGVYKSYLCVLKSHLTFRIIILCV